MFWDCSLQTLRPFPAFPDQPEPLKRYAGGLGGTKAASLQRFLSFAEGQTRKTAFQI